MRLLYLGEILAQESYILWCLKQSNLFERIDHFTKPTLDYTHVHMNPLPDGIVLKCDFEGHELEWNKRYSIEIPRVFVYCKWCQEKIMEYGKYGVAYNMDDAINQQDLMLESLANTIMRVCNGQDN